MVSIPREEVKRWFEMYEVMVSNENETSVKIYSSMLDGSLRLLHKTPQIFDSTKDCSTENYTFCLG